MDVARLQAEPEHGRQRPDRIASVRVGDELRLRGRPRREVEQHGIVGPGRPIRHEAGRSLEGRGIRMPAGAVARTHDDTDDLGTREALAFQELVALGQDGAGTATLDPVRQLVGREQGRGRDHHEAELHRRQGRFPERRHVAEQQEQVIAARESRAGEVIGELVRATAQVGEAEPRIGAGPDVDDAERGPVPALGRSGEFGVEPVDGPIERREVGPGEAGPGRDRRRIGAPTGNHEPVRKLDMSASRHSAAVRHRRLCPKTLALPSAIDAGRWPMRHGPSGPLASATRSWSLPTAGLSKESGWSGNGTVRARLRL